MRVRHNQIFIYTLGATWGFIKPQKTVSTKSEACLELSQTSKKMYHLRWLIGFRLWLTTSCRCSELTCIYSAVMVTVEISTENPEIDEIQLFERRHIRNPTNPRTSVWRPLRKSTLNKSIYLSEIIKLSI